MVRTRATTFDKLLAQGGPCAVSAHGSIRRRDSLQLGVARECTLTKINFAQQVAVDWGYHREGACDACAGRIHQKCVRRCFLALQFHPPSLQCAAFSSFMAIMVDQRVAQNPVEPRHCRFVLAQFSARFESAHVSALQNIFRDAAIMKTPLEKTEKLQAQTKQ